MNKQLLLIGAGDFLVKAFTGCAFVYIGATEHWDLLVWPVLVLLLASVGYWSITLKDRGVLTVLRMLYEHLNMPKEHEMGYLLDSGSPKM